MRRHDEVDVETSGDGPRPTDSSSACAPARDPASWCVDWLASELVSRQRRAAAEENPPGNNLNANEFTLLPSPSPSC